jgi:hypothetical protein
MRPPASPGARDRALVRLTCWLVRRVRARGPLPTALLVAAGLVEVIDGDLYLEASPGVKIALAGVADAAPPRPDAWRRSGYWSKDPEPPARPAPWVRVP